MGRGPTDSIVIDLGRFLGWPTSVSFGTAVWSASGWSCTTPKIAHGEFELPA